MKFAKDESGKDYEVGKNYNKALDEFNKKTNEPKVDLQLFAKNNKDKNYNKAGSGFILIDLEMISMPLEHPKTH